MKKSILLLPFLVTIVQCRASEYENPRKPIKRTPQEMQTLCESRGGRNYRMKTPEELVAECERISTKPFDKRTSEKKQKECEKISKLIYKSKQNLREIIPTRRMRTPEELKIECDKLPQKLSETQRQRECDQIDKFIYKSREEIDREVERELKKEQSPQELQEVCRYMEKEGMIWAWREPTDAEIGAVMSRNHKIFLEKKKAEKQAALAKAKADGEKKKYREAVSLINNQLAMITDSVSIKDAALNTSGAKIVFKDLIDKKLATQETIKKLLQEKIKTLQAIAPSQATPTLVDVKLRYFQDLERNVKAHGEHKKMSR